jgi:hypothetical protein
VLTCCALPAFMDNNMLTGQVIRLGVYKAQWDRFCRRALAGGATAKIAITSTRSPSAARSSA